MAYTSLFGGFLVDDYPLAGRFPKGNGFSSRSFFVYPQPKKQEKNTPDHPGSAPAFFCLSCSVEQYFLKA